MRRGWRPRPGWRSSGSAVATSARIDFRVREGIPYFIEANPLPGLSPGTSDLVILAEGYGISHEDLISRIFETALASARDLRLTGQLRDDPSASTARDRRPWP